MSQFAGRFSNDKDSRHGNRDGRDREGAKQAPHQSAQKLLQNQTPPGPRNLLAKLIHDCSSK